MFQLELIGDRRNDFCCQPQRLPQNDQYQDHGQEKQDASEDGDLQECSHVTPLSGRYRLDSAKAPDN
jgi:hypothetical protein